jgi:sugar/nucleoside kinase (ribokinase family)
MAKVRFLAPSVDQRAGHEGVVYGAGHETDVVAEDYDYVVQLRAEGKVEIIDTTGLPTALKPITRDL